MGGDPNPQDDTVADGSQALQALGERPYSVVLTDLRMPRVSGMQRIQELRERRLPVTVIVTAGYGSVAEAAQVLGIATSTAEKDWAYALRAPPRNGGARQG